MTETDSMTSVNNMDRRGIRRALKSWPGFNVHTNLYMETRWFLLSFFIILHWI